MLIGRRGSTKSDLCPCRMYLSLRPLRKSMKKAWTMGTSMIALCATKNLRLSCTAIRYGLPLPSQISTHTNTFLTQNTPITFLPPIILQCNQRYCMRCQNATVTSEDIHCDQCDTVMTCENAKTATWLTTSTRLLP